MAVVNTFEKGPEGWCSYDYHASIIAGQNYFVPARRGPDPRDQKDE